MSEKNVRKAPDGTVKRVVGLFSGEAPRLLGAALLTVAVVVGTLSLPVLSRRRTEELAALMRRGGFWRFQWALDVEVCYSERGAGWLRRADVEKARARGKSRGENSLPWWAG